MNIEVESPKYDYKVAFTGHRRLKYRDVETELRKIASKYPGSTWICGGAVGLDSAAALFAMLHGIRLWLILPFPPAVMSKFWSPPQRQILADTMKYAEKVEILSATYHVAIYQRRNERMVDLSDTVVAFFDGSPGGTANCVRYAKLVKRPIIMAKLE